MQDCLICPQPLVGPDAIGWSAKLGNTPGTPPEALFALAVEADGVSTMDSSASPVLVNLDAIGNGGFAQAVAVTLPPGSYLAKPVTGTFLAYNAWGLVEQCDTEGRCHFGWSTIFGYHTPAGGQVVPVSKVWETPQLALQRTHCVPIILVEETTVSFWINDAVLEDNLGGVSVQISPDGFAGFHRLDINVAKNAGNVVLTWFGQDGAWYYMLRSTDLRLWEPATGGSSIYLLPEGQGAPLTYVEQANQNQAFFQVFCFAPP